MRRADGRQSAGCDSIPQRRDADPRYQRRPPARLGVLSARSHQQVSRLRNQRANCTNQPAHTGIPTGQERPAPAAPFSPTSGRGAETPPPWPSLRVLGLPATRRQQGQVRGQRRLDHLADLAAPFGVVIGPQGYAPGTPHAPHPRAPPTTRTAARPRRLHSRQGSGGLPPPLAAPTAARHAPTPPMMGKTDGDQWPPLAQVGLEAGGSAVRIAAGGRQVHGFLSGWCGALRVAGRLRSAFTTPITPFRSR